MKNSVQWWCGLKQGAQCFSCTSTSEASYRMVQIVIAYSLGYDLVVCDTIISASHGRGHFMEDTRCTEDRTSPCHGVSPGFHDGMPSQISSPGTSRGRPSDSIVKGLSPYTSRHCSRTVVITVHTIPFVSIYLSRLSWSLCEINGTTMSRSSLL
jgi:hypothetical protein